MIIVCERNLEDHVGETYDEIVEVDDSPTTETIQEWGARIKNKIRRLHNNSIAEGEENPVIQITLDGPSPYNAMLQNLQIFMAEENDIDIELPYLEDFDFDVKSREARDIIDKLDEQQGDE
jgi:hypothetical protein